MVKEVGDALNKYRYKNKKNGVEIPCIGIASWGYTTGNDQLEGCSVEGGSMNANHSRGTRPLLKHRHYNTGHSMRMVSRMTIV